MPQPHRVLVIRDDNDPIPASGKQFICCPKGPGGSGQLPGGVPVRTVEKGDGVGAVAVTKVRRRPPSANAVTLPPPPPEVPGWGEWVEDRAVAPLAVPGKHARER